MAIATNPTTMICSRLAAIPALSSTLPNFARPDRGPVSGNT